MPCRLRGRCASDHAGADVVRRPADPHGEVRRGQSSNATSPSFTTFPSSRCNARGLPMALTDLQVAAALAEMSYRRAERDQQLHVEDVNGSHVGVSVSGLTLNDGFYYNDATGFVGNIVRANGKIFVVYRGTDMAGSLSESAAAQVGYKDSPGIV